MSNENTKSNAVPSPEDKIKDVNSTSATQPDGTKAEKPNNNVNNEETTKAMQDIDALIAEIRMQSQDTTATPAPATTQATSPATSTTPDEEEMVDITELSKTTTFPKVTTTTPVANESVTNQTNSVKKDDKKASTADNTVNLVGASTTAKATPAVKPEKKKSNHTFAKIFCGFLVSLLLSGSTFYYMYKYVPEILPVSASVDIPGGTVKPPEEEVVFLKGIQVAGFDIGGKTLEEAKSLLALRGTAILPPISLSVNYNGVTLDYDNDDFDFTYNLNDAIERAYKYNQEVLDSNSNDIMSKSPTDENAKVDKDKSTVNFEVDYKITEASVKKVVKRVAKEVDDPCVEPHVSKFDTSKSKNSQRYTYTEGSDGTVIDQDELITNAMEAFNNGETEVSLTATGIVDKPKLKMADVKKATKLIGKFSTYTTNTYNANLNMAQSLKAINGTILEPGDTLSFNECTGDSNQTSNGYYPAGVISNGAMTTGVGGGICQTATTLYNAGIMANMEIVEREPHLWCSYYVYGGLDATIDWGNIDLKMKNNTDYQMFFKCWMDGTQLNIEIYGWQSPDFDEVRTETELDWYTSESYGYNSYRVFYKNGKEVEREELPYSVYSLSNGGGIRGADPGDVSKKLKQPE